MLIVSYTFLLFSVPQIFHIRKPLFTLLSSAL